MPNAGLLRVRYCAAGRRHKPNVKIWWRSSEGPDVSLAAGVFTEILSGHLWESQERVKILKQYPTCTVDATCFWQLLFPDLFIFCCCQTSLLWLMMMVILNYSPLSVQWDECCSSSIYFRRAVLLFPISETFYFVFFFANFLHLDFNFNKRLIWLF